MRFFFLLALMIVACGPTDTSTGVCEPAKCAGCCNGNTCVAFASQTNEQCGVGDQCTSCASELLCQQGVCVPADVCAGNNGGCDLNADCTPPPADTLCTCRAGFDGNGKMCTPRLSTLSVSPGFLSPAFRPDLLTYSVIVKSTVTSVTVTGTTLTAGAMVVVNGISNPAVTLTADKTTIGVQAVIASNKSARYTIEVDRSNTSLAENTYAKGSSTVADNRLGRALAVSGDGKVMAVGAPGEATRAGAVFVFRKIADAWAEEAVLRASNAEQADGFGWSVALSNDGSTLVVGVPGEDSDARGIGGNQASNAATDSGAVYVFRHATTWAQEAYVKSSTSDRLDAFGWSVALSADGATLVASAPFDDGASNSMESTGAVFAFTRAGSTWSEQKVIRAQSAMRNLLFGRVVALAADGATLAVGMPAVNAVAVYRAGFAFDAEVKGSNSLDDDQFGSAVALSGDGFVLAVGSPNESTLALGINPTAMNSSAAGSGAAYVYRRGTAWVQEAFVKATNTHEGDVFGTSVALSADGATLACGAPGEDGSSRGIEGYQSSLDAADSGAVFLYRHTGTTWERHAYVKPSNTSPGDVFGSMVALSANGARLVVSAPGDDSNATGINGESMNDSAMESGACFVFDE